MDKMQVILGGEAERVALGGSLHVCRTVMPIAFWYLISLTLTAVNKFLFDTLNLNFPVTVTFIHFAFISLILRLAFACCSYFTELPQVGLRVFAKFIMPIGFFTAADVALTNMSYAMVSISVITVMKSSICAVTYFICILFGLEKFSWALSAVVMFVVVSISMTVPAMEIHNVWGPVLLSLAVLSASLRWVIVHRQLQRADHNPMELMLLTQPTATVFLALPALFLETPSLIGIGNNPTIDVQKGVAALVLVLLSIVVALFLILVEYHIVQVTSSLTFTVAGVGKEIVTILMSIIAFNEVVELRPAIGIGLSVLGILAYSAIRRAQETKHIASHTLPHAHISSARSTGEDNHQQERHDGGGVFAHKNFDMKNEKGNTLLSEDNNGAERKNEVRTLPETNTGSGGEGNHYRISHSPNSDTLHSMRDEEDWHEEMDLQ